MNVSVPIVGSMFATFGVGMIADCNDGKGRECDFASTNELISTLPTSGTSPRSRFGYRMAWTRAKVVLIAKIQSKIL